MDSFGFERTLVVAFSSGTGVRLKTLSLLRKKAVRCKKGGGRKNVLVHVAARHDKYTPWSCEQVVKRRSGRKKQVHTQRT